MTAKTKGNARLDAELLEMAKDMRGTLLRKETADKITMRVLGDKAPAKPVPLAAADIRALREQAHMSQAVFASLLNVTTGYLSQWERGAKHPTGPALALLHVIRRKGVQALIDPHQDEHA
ncbi:MAG: helix-turn-helix domain-containing protein [Rhodomicrobium sp.]